MMNGVRVKISFGEGLVGMAKGWWGWGWECVMGKGEGRGGAKVNALQNDLFQLFLLWNIRRHS